jgi:F420-non-reducing hydrogenase iron-sulfur subunit
MAFEPKILAFTCDYCAYSGTDLAGISRAKHPFDARIIRVMCSGRVDPGMIFRAFEHGADGVLVAGCHKGDCNYLYGSEKAEEKVGSAKELAEALGLGKDRIRLEWFSASEGRKFTETIKDFAKKLKKMGPSPAGAVR